MKIMIVDNDDRTRQMVKSSLMYMPEFICECQDGAEALQIYDLFEPDWVLMDADMRGLDGVTAGERIVRKHPEARIVLFGPSDDGPHRISAREAGVVGFVSKERLAEINRYLFNSRAQTVLLVEDEPDIRDVVHSALAAAGYVVLTAKDGVEAVEVFSRHASAIDLVIMDIGLPKLDGIHALAEIRRRDTGVKILFCSGYLEPLDKERTVEPGVTEFLPKPYDPDEVVARVRNMIGVAEPSTL